MPLEKNTIIPYLSLICHLQLPIVADREDPEVVAAYLIHDHMVLCLPIFLSHFSMPLKLLDSHRPLLQLQLQPQQLLMEEVYHPDFVGDFRLVFLLMEVE